MKKENKGVAETVVLVQSLLLFLFGVAGYMASSSINDSFNALTNSETAVAIIVDGKVATSDGDITLEQAARVVGNFETVCFVAMFLGLMVLAASLARRWIPKK